VRWWRQVEKRLAIPKRPYSLDQTNLRMTLDWCVLRRSLASNPGGNCDTSSKNWVVDGVCSHWRVRGGGAE
jgi:hypothetical protein